MQINFILPSVWTPTYSSSACLEAWWWITPYRVWGMRTADKHRKQRLHIEIQNTISLPGAKSWRAQSAPYQSWPKDKKNKSSASSKGMGEKGASDHHSPAITPRPHGLLLRISIRRRIPPFCRHDGRIEKQPKRLSTAIIFRLRRTHTLLQQSSDVDSSFAHADKAKGRSTTKLLLF